MLSDESKNAYESLIYSFRSWLNDEDNSVFVLEEERESWLEKLEAGEEWLYDEGAALPYTEYKERSNELNEAISIYESRKKEYNFREHLLPVLL